MSNSIVTTTPLADLLASTQHGAGAALIAIEDAAGKITATTVEGALAELAAGGGFGADTFIDLQNASSANVPALELVTALTNNVAGSEASKWTIRTLAAGAPFNALVINNQGIVLPAGLTGLTVGTQLIWDDGSGNLRMGLRSHFLGNDAFILNPATQANAAFYLDGTVAGGIHQSGVGIVALKGGGANQVFVSATGVSFLGVTTPIARQTVTGSRGANAALASLLTALAAFGLILDSSS